MTLYFFWGDEDYLLENEVNFLKEKILGPDIDAFNFKTFNNPSFPALIEALYTPSLMLSSILYVIKADKYFLETKTKFKLDDKQNAALIDALQNLNPSLNVILLCPFARGESKKPDSRKKLYKEVEKIAKIKHFPALKPWETYKAVDWVKQRIKAKDLKFNSDAVTYFIQNVGVNFRELEKELEKIKLTIYPDKIVSKETINKYCIQNADMFNFCDHILSKNKDAALEALNDILEKQHYLPVLAFLQNNFRKWILAKMYSEHLSTSEIAKKTSMNEYALKKMLEKLRPVSLESLIRLKQNFTEAEFKIKTGEIDAVLALEMEISKSV